ncbi:uncharacterized protein GlcG (DUF336 family) [Pedobacter sp. UYEF25]
MKLITILFTLLTATAFAQSNGQSKSLKPSAGTYVRSINTLTLNAAFELTKVATAEAASLNKTVSIAVLDAFGNIILLVRGENVGPHNTEASRRKAYTALSTRTATLVLLRNAQKNPDTENLNTLPELLLMSGGTPIWYKAEVIGSIGISGGGSAENDDLIAKSAVVKSFGFTTSK